MIYVGNNAIDSVCFSDYYKEYDKDFTESVWEVNTTNGWEVEFTKRQAIIKKFKIDTWGIRRNIKTPTNVYDKYVSWVLDVSGLDYVNKNIITFGKSYYPTGGWKGYDDATSFAPGKFPNDTYPSSSCQYVSGLIVQLGGHYNNSDSVKYPSEQMLMHPWDVGNRVRVSDGLQTGTWGDGSYSTVLIGLYGGSQDSTSEDYYKIYDISDHPIILTLTPNLIDPQSQECWKIYYKNQTQEKEKTFENNWVKYKYVTEKTVGNSKYWSLSSENYTNTIKDPPTVSYNFAGEMTMNGETQVTIKPWVTFNYKAKDQSFWIPIKEWFLNNKIVNGLSGDYALASTTPTLFSNSNIAGELTLNLGPNIYALTDFINGTSLEKVNLIFEKVPYFSTLNMFRSASKLTSFTTNKSLPASEMAGVFEWCSSLTTIPANFWKFEFRNRYNQSNFCYTFEGCKNLVEVPMSSNTTDVNSDKNTIRTETINQTFNNCPKLEKFLPILDLEGCHPDNSYLAFAGCTALTHILIKNLNKGDWRFDGTSSKKLGTLTNLDTESVKYLFNNVKDIAHSVVETESQNNSFSNTFWTREDQQYSYNSNKIIPDQLCSVCLSDVNTQIYMYKSQVNNFNKIYFLPQEKVNASDMDSYKLEWTDSDEFKYTTINSNGNSNYGFYIDSSEFKTSSITVFMKKPWDRCSSSVATAKIYIPEVWKTDNRFTQSEIDTCNNRGWHIYIGDSEVTTLTTE